MFLSIEQVPWVPPESKRIRSQESAHREKGSFISHLVWLEHQTQKTKASLAFLVSFFSVLLMLRAVWEKAYWGILSQLLINVVLKASFPTISITFVLIGRKNLARLKNLFENLLNPASTTANGYFCPPPDYKEGSHEHRQNVWRVKPYFKSAYSPVVVSWNSWSSSQWVQSTVIVPEGHLNKKLAKTWHHVSVSF